MAAESGSIKRYLPKSLFGRALMILLLPILLLQVVLTLVIIQRHYDRVTAQMSGLAADELRYAIAQAEDAPDIETARRRLAELGDALTLEITLGEGPAVQPGARRNWYDLTGSVIAETLVAAIDRPLQVDLVRFDKRVETRVETTHGTLSVLIPRRRANASNPHQLLLWMVLAAVPLTAVAVLFLRNQIRPIRELAAAATAFGRGRNLAFRPSGADEVRRAGHAFLDMRSRIERQIEQRTAMLSAVSHDLRTPLTRMKLALAVASDDPEAAGLGRDVAEMEQMVEGYLAFARGEGAEPAVPVDPAELAEEIAADARRQGEIVSVVIRNESSAARSVDLRPRAMKRCLANLVNNAAAHGAEIRLSVRLARRAVEFMVEDDGPGIPPDSRDEMLKPFTRLDPARGQGLTPGVGLGLSIALDIAHAHGGTLTLDESPSLGGLRATVLIPR